MIILVAAALLVQDGPKIEWTTTEVEYDGEKVSVRRGTLEVPERYEGLSRVLKLPVASLPARGEASGPPVVFLHGGPGGSGLGYAQSDAGEAFFSAMRDSGEVVVFDQRGGPMTTPALIAPLSRLLPEDVLLSQERFLEYFVAEAKSAVRAFEGKADLTCYTTVENARDLDMLRQALGVEKIKLLAHSYGTHLAQAYLKQFPDRVESAVLMGTEGLDMTVKLPGTYKKQLDQLTELIKVHPNTKNDVPNFTLLLQRAVAKLDREPLIARIPVEGEFKEYKIGGFGLMWLLRWDIGDTADLPMFPRIVHAAYDGNVTPLLPMLRKRHSQVSSGFPLVSLVMDEASGVDPARLDLVEKESAGFFFASVVNMGFDALAGQLGGRILGPDFRQPVRSNVPTLFVSGTLDSNTPPSQAEQVRTGFPRSWHLVIRNGGHEDCLWNKDVITAVVKFLKSGTSQSRVISLPVPDFQPILKN
jgi:pimeloyl-ACP methyl ester carboxylesterase